MFQKNQLDDLVPAGFTLDGVFDPVFGLIIQPETPLTHGANDQIIAAMERQYVAAVNGKKVGCVRVCPYR
jgi:hypothetical protein